MPPAKRRGNVAKTSGAMKYVQEPRKPNKRGSLSLAASGSSGDLRDSSSYNVREATEDDAEAISALCVRTSALHSLLAALDADMRRWVLQREIGVGAIALELDEGYSTFLVAEDLDGNMVGVIASHAPPSDRSLCVARWCHALTGRRPATTVALPYQPPLPTAMRPPSPEVVRALVELEAEHGVEHAAGTPRGQTPIKRGGALASIAFFEQLTC